LSLKKPKPYRIQTEELAALEVREINCILYYESI